MSINSANVNNNYAARVAAHLRAVDMIVENMRNVPRVMAMCRDYDRRIEEKMDRDQAGVAAMHREHEERVAAMRRDYDRSVAEMHREHEERVTAMRRDHDNEWGWVSELFVPIGES